MKKDEVCSQSTNATDDAKDCDDSADSHDRNSIGIRMERNVEMDHLLLIGDSETSWPALFLCSEPKKKSGRPYCMSRDQNQNVLSTKADSQDHHCNRNRNRRANNESLRITTLFGKADTVIFHARDPANNKTHYKRPSSFFPLVRWKGGEGASFRNRFSSMMDRCPSDSKLCLSEREGISIIEFGIP